MAKDGPYNTILKRNYLLYWLKLLTYTFFACKGDMVGCIGVSEPGGGSDVANIKTKAVKKKGSDDLIILGEIRSTTCKTKADPYNTMLSVTIDFIG